MADEIVTAIEQEINEKRSWIQNHPFTSVGLGAIAGFIILAVLQVVF